MCIFNKLRGITYFAFLKFKIKYNEKSKYFFKYKKKKK